MNCAPTFLGGVSCDDHIRWRKVHGTAVCIEGVSTTTQVLLWHSMTGQTKRRKTPGLFVGPLSDLTASYESVVKLAKWLVSRTLTDLLNLLGFAM